MWWKIIWIVAMDEDRIIGKDWWMPRHIPEDLERFKQHVQNQICLMGRKTYEWLKKYRPNNEWYPHAKKNLIFSENMPDTPEIEIVRSVEEVKQKYKDEVVWVLWWAKTYETFMPYFNELYVTLVGWKHEWDTRMPKIPPHKYYKETLRETKSWLKFQKYTRITEPEALNIMNQYKKPMY